MVSVKLQKVAMACCWLAAKLEESPRRTRDVISVFYRMERRREGKPLTPLDIYGSVSPPILVKSCFSFNSDSVLLRSVCFITLNHIELSF